MYVTELTISLVSFFFQFQDTRKSTCFAYLLNLCFCPPMLRNSQMDSYSYNKDCDILNTNFSIVISPDLDNRCSFFPKYMQYSFVLSLSFVCLFVWVFYRPTRQFFTHMETSPLPVKDCKF